MRLSHCCISLHCLLELVHDTQLDTPMMEIYLSRIHLMCEASLVPDGRTHHIVMELDALCNAIGQLTDLTRLTVLTRLRHNIDDVLARRVELTHTERVPGLVKDSGKRVK